MENKNEVKVEKLNVKVTDKVYTTKEMSAALGMTGKQLRRILRSMDTYNDGIYTRYAWSKKDYDKIVKAIKANIDAKVAAKEAKAAKAANDND